jgi:SAM-dependent methyltransferase
VDAGCGPGGSLAHWRELGFEPLGLEASPRAEAIAARAGRPVRRVELGEPWPVESGLRAVLLLDVLEHLSAPAAVLRCARETLAEDGVVVVTVPALPVLFGPWDRKLGHQRRYTAQLLRRHANEARLAVVWLSAWNAVSLPLAAPIRLAQRAGDALGLVDRTSPPVFPRTPRWLDRALRRAARAEHRLVQRHRLPLGLSIAAVLRREPLP